MEDDALRLLIVTAHPADSFDQAGGTLAHHAERGDHVTACMLTTGVRSHDWQLLDARLQGDKARASESDATRAVSKKEDEVREACAIMGITDLRFIEQEDDLVLVTRELVTGIARVIRDVKPDVIITHHPYEDGGVACAHAATAQATLNAMHMAGGMPVGDEDQPHRVAEVYFMNPTQGILSNALSVALHGHVDVWVDITDVIERKVRALDCIRSQHYHGMYSRKRGEATDGHFGVAAAVPYAEGFQRYRPPVRRYLPISRFSLKKAKEPLASHLGRYSHLMAHTVPLPNEYTKPQAPDSYGLPTE